MTISTDIARFLRTDAGIARINFSLASIKFYPSAFRTDVADAYDKGLIKVTVGGRLAPGAGSSYDVLFDELTLDSTFAFGSSYHEALLVHECAHTAIDMRDIGVHSTFEDEAAAYLCEAIFLESSGAPPVGSDPVRLVSHPIAKKVLAGTYWVDAADVTALCGEIARHPHYATRSTHVSNAFRRDTLRQLLR